ncbi:hypothetical protein ABEB36_003334 [Hypothenemus hampei]|uniref:F-box domain-containing protein n=1 Tax=Hypothenemus hampei TaxID=57062 RepID=A0ABD1FCG1_HYPHA
MLGFYQRPNKPTTSNAPNSIFSSGYTIHIYTMKRTNYKLWTAGRVYEKKPYRYQDIDLLNPESVFLIELEAPFNVNDFMLHPIWKETDLVVRVWATSYEEVVPCNWHLLYTIADSKHSMGHFNECPEIVNMIRIEFKIEFENNFRKFVLVVNKKLRFLVEPLIKKTENKIQELTTSVVSPESQPGINFTEGLATEVLFKIFDYLDIKSLSRCAQVNQRWNLITKDRRFYREVDLTVYWNKLNTNTLKQLKPKLKSMKRLDVEVDGQFYCPLFIYPVASEGFHSILRDIVEDSKDTLIQLCLNIPYELDSMPEREFLETTLSCAKLKELRLPRSLHGYPLNLENCLVTKLSIMDFSMSGIKEAELIIMLQYNPDLEHLVIDHCIYLVYIDPILKAVIIHNKKLKSWSSWKTFQNVYDLKVYEEFGKLVHLEDLDLGHCEPELYDTDFLLVIGSKCKKLRRLSLVNWGQLTDEILLPMFLETKEITHLNLSNMYQITPVIMLMVITYLPKLQILNVKNCEEIYMEIIEQYRQKYSHVKINEYR